jgi:hypothetical protein
MSIVGRVLVGLVLGAGPIVSIAAEVDTTSAIIVNAWIVDSCFDASATETQRSVLVPMRDGAVLSTDLHFPPEGAGPWPVVLLRTAYGKNRMLDDAKFLPRLVAAGFVVATQDVRGRYESTGRFQPGRYNRVDGYDTVSGWRDRAGRTARSAAPVAHSWARCS